SLQHSVQFISTGVVDKSKGKITLSQRIETTFDTQKDITRPGHPIIAGFAQRAAGGKIRWLLLVKVCRYTDSEFKAGIITHFHVWNSKFISGSSFCCVVECQVDFLNIMQNFC